MSSSRNLGESFNEYFELLPALDDASREAVFRIRHEVYCRDLGWEPIREDGLERDAFDAQSVHCLLRHRVTGEPVGCTRLILADAAHPEALLPVESSCAAVLDRSIVDPAQLPRRTVAEVSRLAVMRNFRQRKGESQSAATVSDDDFQSRGQHARFPYIPVSLYFGAAAIARRLGREHVLVLTEPRLAAHFSRLGVHIQSIGGSIEHRGQRVPSLFITSRFAPGLRPLIRPLYDTIERSVDACFDAHQA
ncbi:PEP-CTERM/exosortase system-associated acyltransferase [Roseateles saccharophilus]|uniref:N-acyl amino acid synthase of PEP-CTERM/exosortase system n=1 Tax=Roseateles saccharophilus TaxID=304 RepID=A0A4R3V1T1_ROSSA|nr:PEP-CTERM/exosortase system-associated acyltransferase [Roseateles saccharophilus]MDG0831933.1 PEP-CTERM/exosortase system-associated acyltransferase [Roseateles saccharophilus]TCU97401.1 N-acyl amino acid synthase of PEP-CTERM/exosortase system [Roseateles saccharophilus]